MEEKNGPPKIDAKYMRRFWIGMGLYVVFILIGSSIVAVRDDESVLAYVLMLLPAIPAIFAMVNMFWGILELDELERRIQMEGVTVAAFVASGFAFIWGLLEYASLVPHFHTFLFAPGMIAVWGFASTRARRRYQ